MISPTNAVAALWVVWLIIWLVGAAATAKDVEAQTRSARLTHSVFIWLGALLIFVHWRTLGALALPLFPRQPWISWTGVAFVAIGLGFAVWARFHLGRFWSGWVTLKEDHAIIRTGPYALVRHPIYTGLLMAFAGTALARLTIATLTGIALILAGLIVKIGQEERLLIHHFGAGYDAYRADVRALIPYVW